MGVLTRLLPQLPALSLSLEARDRAGMRPVHRAALRGAVAALAALLAAGASPLPQTSFGATPLHFAVLGGHPDAWNMLLASRKVLEAFPPLLDCFGRNAVALAVESGWSIHDHSFIAEAAGCATGGTALLSDPACMQHHTCAPEEVRLASAPPENTRRLVRAYVCISVYVRVYVF